MPTSPSKKVSPEYRGRLHYSPPFGWINDPNGLSWFEGQYHLFYQHHPEDSVWGPMHWGHAVSTDLLRWTTLPVALAPGNDYDADGCFSGTAVEDRGRQALIYTGHVDPEPGNESRRRQVQCLAWGDGTTYQKDPKNPVIGTDLLPPGSSAADFRDPKVWKEDGRWYCLAANADTSGLGRLLLFTADKPTHWRFVGVAASSGGRLGRMWECPDFFTVAGREVLLWSVMDQSSGPGVYQNSHSVVWAPGTLDRSTGAFTGGEPAEIDHGPDFYAPQTLSTPDGRTVLIAWMQMWGRSMPTHELGHGWAGQMTVPREVFWKEGRLAQRPVRELETYRGPVVSVETAVVGAASFAGVEGRHLDLELEFSAWTGPFSVELMRSRDGAEFTELSYDPASGWLSLDRSRGGHPIVGRIASHPEANRFRARVEAPAGALKLRLLLDRSSVEVFAQDGLTTLTSTVYPTKEGDGLTFRSAAGSVRLRASAWPLRLPSRGL